MNSPKKIPLSVSMDADTALTLRRLAHREKRSVGDILREATREYLSNAARFNKPTNENAPSARPERLGL